jgi:hypothetical protein
MDDLANRTQITWLCTGPLVARAAIRLVTNRYHLITMSLWGLNRIHFGGVSSPGPMWANAASRGRPYYARRPGDRARTGLVTTYALMGVLLAGYLALLVVRGTSGDSLLVSGWGAASFELAAGALCLARGVTQRPGRAVLTLGFAITSWALGDFALTTESLGGANPPPPSLADTFYLGFYPLAYVAAVLFIREDTQRGLPACGRAGDHARGGQAGGPPRRRISQRQPPGTRRQRWPKGESLRRRSRGDQDLHVHPGVPARRGVWHR